MFKGRKFKKAEKEFAKGSKTFDEFCSENDIEIKPKKKNVKRNVWISISATVATAAIVVCSCIPLMRQSPIEEYYYSDGGVTTNQITIDDIVNNSRREFRLFDINYLDDYIIAQSVCPNNNDNIILGYFIGDVLWYREYQDVEYVFEFDYVIRMDRHYRFKDLALYNDSTDTVNNSDISFKYRIADNEIGNDVYITYAYNGIDYFVHMFESEFTSEYSKENIDAFIRLAF